MELKSTHVGRHLAQHPYNKVTLLNAGIEVSGERHSMIIPFTQLISIKCKRGIIWGELEFELPDRKVVRLHGTEWPLTQRFYQRLNESWAEWGAEMSERAAHLLSERLSEISQVLAQKPYLDDADLKQIQDGISQTLSSLPLLSSRLPEFENCAQSYRHCLNWLNEGEQLVEQINHKWREKCLQDNQAFFDTIETQPLNMAQRRAVISVSRSSLVLAGAGCGKTAVLVARAGWLLHSEQATAEQILLLAFSRRAAEEMKSRLSSQLPGVKIAVKTFHSLALDIIQSCNARKSKADDKKAVAISPLETNSQLRNEFLIKCWQNLCEDKKSYANGWRKWLTDEFEWELDESQFWQNKKLIAWLSIRLDRWLSILRSTSASQADIIASVAVDIRDVTQKRLRLLTPLLKAWKAELKQQQTVDFTGLITQATNLLKKGKFNSPWQHILIDEFQDISPQRVALIDTLRKQSDKEPALFAVGDDWQTIYRFNGAELTLTTLFEQTFGNAERFVLDTTYRFNQEIAEITNDFIQQNPHQIKKTLQSEFHSKTDPVVILPQQQLENLLDKLSGFVKPDENVLILARYHYLYPDILKIAAVRWPNLKLEFMTIHNSKGQQADYVIILGLQDGWDGFPAPARESLIEQALLPVLDDFPDAEERRLLYVALTRARHKVWLLEDRENPSVFVKQLHKCGAVIKRKA